jgi:hypothetical protein
MCQVVCIQNEIERITPPSSSGLGKDESYKTSTINPIVKALQAKMNPLIRCIQATAKSAVGVKDFSHIKDELTTALSVMDDTAIDAAAAITLRADVFPKVTSKSFLSGSFKDITEGLRLLLPMCSALGNKIENMSFFMAQLRETRAKLQIIMEDYRKAQKVCVYHDCMRNLH